MSIIYQSSSDPGEVDFVDLEDEDSGVVYCEITPNHDESLMLADEDEKENRERTKKLIWMGLRQQCWR